MFKCNQTRRAAWSLVTRSASTLTKSTNIGNMYWSSTSTKYTSAVEICRSR